MRIKRNYKKDYRPGLVLILVLWVLVVLAVLAVALSQDTRLDSALRVVSADRVIARWLARAGVQRAVSELAGDTTPTDSADDSWYDNEEVFKNAELVGGTYTVFADRFFTDDRCAYGVIDEAGKVNINVAPAEQIARLVGIDKELAGAITTWQQHSDEAEKNSAKRMEYIATIRQLALVEGMTDELFYGEDRNFNGILDDNEDDGDLQEPGDNKDGRLDRGLLAYVTIYSYELNQDGQGRRRININRASREQLEIELGLTKQCAQWIVVNRPFGNIAELLSGSETIITIETESVSPLAWSDEVQSLNIQSMGIRPDIAVFRRIADRITVTDEEVIPGRININTAPEPVLRTLPTVDQSLAQRIIQYRRGHMGGFTNIADLLAVPNFTVTQFKNAAPYITVRSNVFTIRSCGRADRSGITHFIEAVIDRGKDKPSVLYWKESK